MRNIGNKITQFFATLKRKKYNYDPNNLNGYLPDTNYLIRHPDVLKNYKCFIPSHVLREVEHLELTKKSDKLLQLQIRAMKRVLDNFDDFIDVKDYKFTLRKEWDKSYVDNILVQICLEENLAIITGDRLLKKKCQLYGIVVVEAETSDFVDNKGYKETFVTQEDYFKMLSNPTQNVGLMKNEYIIVNNVEDSELLDIMKWTGTELVTLRDENGLLGQGFSTLQFGDFKPIDEQQIMAEDSIRSNQVTSIRGRAGSGKSLVALNVAWHMVEKEGYKLVIFVNPVPVLNSQELGFYKGDRLEKLMQSAVGTMLKSKFGDEIEILRLIEEGKMEILPFVDLRGYDSGDNKTIVWVMEAQNLTSELLKLGLQRIAVNTKVIVDGDYSLQVDKDIYAADNGMKRMSEVFRGTHLYGEVELQKVWRSEVADMAEQM